MLSTATPTWSVAVSTAPPRISIRLLGAGRERGRLGGRGGEAEMNPGPAVGRGHGRSGPDVSDLLALQHLVGEQRAGELVELDAVAAQKLGGGAEGLVGQ